MTEEVKEARNAYAREWRRTHPERTKEIQDAYWMRKAQETARLQSLVQTLPVCSCGHRPHIRKNRKQYEISCVFCRRSLPPVDSAEDALEAWKKLGDCKRRTTDAAPYTIAER